MNVEPYLAVGAKVVVLAFVQYKKLTKNEERIKKLELEVQQLKRMLKKAA